MVTQSLGHTVTRLLAHMVTWSLGQLVTRSLGHSESFFQHGYELTNNIRIYRSASQTIISLPHIVKPIKKF